MVDRFTPMYAETATDRFCHMLQSPTGSFVLASDYDALAAERDRLAAELAEARGLLAKAAFVDGRPLEEVRAFLARTEGAGNG